jgi:glutaredoxin
MNDIIVFYSPRCQFCVKLLKTLESSSIPTRLINIHNKDEFKASSAKFLKQVPTILARDSPVPFEGKMAFQYVENRLNFEFSTCDITKAANIPTNSNSELLKYNPNQTIVPFVGTVESSGTDINHPTLLQFDKE